MSPDPPLHNAVRLNTHRFIARLFPQILFAQKRCAEILESEISERLNEYDQKGKGSKVDMLNWMIEDAPDDDERSVFNLAMRVITLNFASIHTTSLVSPLCSTAIIH